MTGKPACTLRAKSTAELCENMQSAIRALVLDLGAAKAE